MGFRYFAELSQRTNTRLWINNPSEVEVRRALEAGAVSCTTNPAYCSKLVSSDSEYFGSLADKVIAEYPDPELAAVVVYQEASRRLMQMFRPQYEASSGNDGFVTMQDDPRTDDSTEAIIAGIEKNRKLGPNYMAKIPVIYAGIRAIEYCVEEDLPICATEVFSISQAIHVCERYEEVAHRTGNRPPFYVTHISGIFDEYLSKLARRRGLTVSDAALQEAGLVVARKQYRLMKERGYTAILLGGGARRPEHFTGLVGGDAHITINWSTVAEIDEGETPVENKIEEEASPTTVDELRSTFPDFARAYDDEGLEVGEYASYGPVQLFRNAFLKGWYLLLAEISHRKTVQAR